MINISNGNTPNWQKNFRKGVYNGKLKTLGIFDKNGIDLRSINNGNSIEISGIGGQSFDILYDKELDLENDLYDINGNVFGIMGIIPSDYFINVINIAISKYEHIKSNSNYLFKEWLNSKYPGPIFGSGIILRHF